MTQLTLEGAYCGYLPTLAGIAGGADQAYINEEQFTLHDLQEDVNHVKAKIEDGVKRFVALYKFFITIVVKF